MILAEYSNENSLNIVGSFKVTMLCFSARKELNEFSESLWLNYNKTVRNGSLSDFNSLELASYSNVAYQDDQENAPHIYKLRIYENQITFLSDVDSSKSLKNSFRFEFIENCDVNYKKTNNRLDANRLYRKMCCVGLKVNWPGEYSKKIDLCSLNRHETMCIVEIRNLEKTLTNNCRKVMANLKYYELNKSNQYPPSINPFICSNNSNNGTNASNKTSSVSTFTYNISNTTSISNVSNLTLNKSAANSSNNSNLTLKQNGNPSSSTIVSTISLSTQNNSPAVLVLNPVKQMSK